MCPRFQCRRPKCLFEPGSARTFVRVQYSKGPLNGLIHCLNHGGTPSKRSTHMSEKTTESSEKVVAAATKRPRLSQEDVPGYSLDQALRVARAIADNYAYKPTRPMHVASAMKMTPTSGPFRGIT